MDKLKAIQYFVAAVETGSFAQAAQRLEISVPAVQKLIGALESSLGLTLLERSARGVRPTPSGADYLDRCRALLAEAETLQLAERHLLGTAERPSGTLAVAAHPQLAHHVLLPALPRFHALYPDVEIDFRAVNRLGDVDAQSADVLLLHGWPDVPADYVHRVLGGARSLIMAAPDHWARHGVPGHPAELERHPSLVMRNPAGILLDLWEFSRAGETVQVKVRAWMSSNAREAMLDLVLGGHGVGRFTELTTRGHVRSGRLVPVLLDWTVHGGPPVNLLYKGQARGSAAVRAFVDFTLQCLRDLDVRTDGSAPPDGTERPTWHRRGYARASALLKRGA
ncbi:MAG: hypothetical protein RIQ60_3495 [Pseudomonadota bacterium]|jgi:DNA-binding transcriptional LysR family regulator